MSRLEEIRREKGLTPAGLAAMAGLTRQGIRRLESGGTPLLDTARRISTALGVPMETIWPTLTPVS